MKGALNLRVSWWGMLLGVVVAAGCANFPGQSPAPAPATPSSAAPPASSRSGSTNASPPKGSPASSATPAQVPGPTPALQPDPPPPSALQVQLSEGIRLFDQGEFYAAAGRLRNLPDLNAASVETQTKAIKYLAFSYCVTNRRTLCQQQFETALKLDPKFELAPAERGHPIWKVVFERAKKAGEKSTPVKGAEKKAVDSKVTDKKPEPKAQENKAQSTTARDSKAAQAQTADKKASGSGRIRKGADKTAVDQNRADPKPAEPQRAQDARPAPN